MVRRRLRKHDDRVSRILIVRLRPGAGLCAHLPPLGHGSVRKTPPVCLVSIVILEDAKPQRFEDMVL